MLKKIASILLIVVCFLGLTTVEASEGSTNFINLQSYMDVYKLSEDSDVDLPFVKFFNERATFDKKITNSGISIGAKAVEIENDVKGVQFIMSSDTVNIKGSVEYAMIIASNVVISGNVEKDIFILSESVFITDTATIGGDVVILSDKVEMKGTAQGNVISSAGTFLLEGTVQKDFRVHSAEMTFGDTDIKGDIYIKTNSDLDLSDKYSNAVVEKIQTSTLTKAEKREEIKNTISKSVVAILLFTALNLIVRKIKPDMFKKWSQKFIAHSSFAIVAGVAALTTLPVVIIFALVCSLFGIGVVTTPLAILYVAILIAVIALAKFIVGSVAYEIINSKLNVNGKPKNIGILLLVFTALHVLCYIPYIYWFMTVATVLLSAGIVVTGIVRKQ